MPAECTRAARAMLAPTSTVSSRSGIGACGRRWQKAWPSQRSPLRRLRLSPDYASLWRTSRPPTPSSCPTGPIRSTLVVNRELLRNGQSDGDSRSARHIELALPAGMEYQTGDHLGVLPATTSTLSAR